MEEGLGVNSIFQNSLFLSDYLLFSVPCPPGQFGGRAKSGWNGILDNFLKLVGSTFAKTFPVYDSPGAAYFRINKPSAFK
ncbi:MAG: hypothetical protein WAS94_03300 [Candidatus Saccharimonadales bacterium]|jgi:hypothetical protein